MIISIFPKIFKSRKFLSSPPIFISDSDLMLFKYNGGSFKLLYYPQSLETNIFTFPTFQTFTDLSFVSSVRFDICDTDEPTLIVHGNWELIGHNCCNLGLPHQWNLLYFINTVTP